MPHPPTVAADMPPEGSLIEEIQFFWNEAERVASLFDSQVHPQHEEMTITQPDLAVDTTQNIESQTDAEMTNFSPKPRRTKKTSTVASTSRHPRTRSRTSLRSKFTNTIDKPVNLD